MNHLITKHSFFELYKIGIPSVEWEEYVEESQLQDKKDYLIAVIKDWNSKYERSEVISGRDNQLAYIQELLRCYGKNSIVIIQEVPIYLETGTLVVFCGKGKISGKATVEDCKEFDKWILALSMNYLFEEEILIKWGKDIKGRLLVTEID